MKTVYILIALYNILPPLQGELLCLSCKNVASPAQCFSVAKCGAFDECYVEAFVNSLGSLRYDFGCKDSQICTRLGAGPPLAGKRQANHVYLCAECCNDTMCNLGGCGYNGFPPRNSRGPLCFACNSQYTIDGCPEFKVCNRGEVCVLEEVPSQTSGEITYKTDCIQAHSCETAYQRLSMYSSMVGKRNVAHSVSIGNECKIECCDDDLCNRACNVTNQSVSTSMTSSKPIFQTTKAVTSSSAVSTTPTTTVRSSSTVSITPTTTVTLTTSMTTAPSTWHSSTRPNTTCTDKLRDCKDPDFLLSVCQVRHLEHYCRKSCGHCAPVLTNG